MAHRRYNLSSGRVDQAAEPAVVYEDEDEEEGEAEDEAGSPHPALVLPALAIMSDTGGDYAELLLAQGQDLVWPAAPAFATSGRDEDIQRDVTTFLTLAFQNLTVEDQDAGTEGEELVMNFPARPNANARLSVFDFSDLVENAEPPAGDDTGQLPRVIDVIAITPSAYEPTISSTVTTPQPAGVDGAREFVGLIEDYSSSVAAMVSAADVRASPIFTPSPLSILDTNQAAINLEVNGAVALSPTATPLEVRDVTRQYQPAVGGDGNPARFEHRGRMLSLFDDEELIFSFEDVKDMLCNATSVIVSAGVAAAAWFVIYESS